MKSKLPEVNVSIIGLGGNGQIAAMILSSMGFNLGVIDGDVVEDSNLTRQPIFGRNDIGRNKAETVFNKIEGRTTTGKLKFYSEYIDSSNIESLLQGTDFIFESTDSFLTRELINEYAVMKKIPWLMTNSYGDFGEFMLIVPGQTACLNCMTTGKRMIPLNCHGDQVSPPVPNTISAMGTSIFLNFLDEGIIDNNFYFYSASGMELQKIKIARSENCEICSKLNFKKLNNKGFLGRQIY